MVKNIANKVRLFWQDFAQKEKSEKKMMLKYFLGFFILTVIIIEGFFLWQGKNERAMLSGQEAQTREKNGFIISPVQKDSAKDAKIILGTSDSSFESATYTSTKNVVTKNVDSELDKNQSHSGKSSFKIKWGSGQQKSVRLNNYLQTQKDKFYKISLWISSAKDSQLALSLSDKNSSVVVASVGIIANADNNFSYYEYNFRSSIDATNLEFSSSGGEEWTVFIDDIMLMPLTIDKDEKLPLIKTTLIGANHVVKIDQKQSLRTEYFSALASPHTLFGQVFSPAMKDFYGVSFFLTKKGDGGVGDYILELREFDGNEQNISADTIAVATFLAKDVKDGDTFFPLRAKLDAGKKYWIGINNGGVNVDAANYLVLGGASTNSAYSGGDSFLRRDKSKIYTEQKDLYFTTSYIEPLKLAMGNLPYGETIYDLGNNVERLDYELSQDKGSSILDVYSQKDVSTDKWENISLKSDDAYLAYEINTNQSSVEKLTLTNLSFHNNIQLSLSVDGKLWTEIYADNSGKLWQNSGNIEVSFRNAPQNIFIMLRKNGKSKSVFVRGEFVLNLIGQNYGK
jgi:hypothetical protein